VFQRTERVLGHLGRKRRVDASDEVRATRVIQARQIRERVPVELQPCGPLLGLVERVCILCVDVLERPGTRRVSPEGVPLGRVLHRSNRFDVHQQQHIRGLVAGVVVRQLVEVVGRELEPLANPLVQ
jgi:hypothetical protein